MCAPRVCDCEQSPRGAPPFELWLKARVPARGMAPPSAAELVAAWLAERRGGSVLKDIWVKPLAALFDEDEWELGDIVTDLTDVTTLPGRRAMWAAILAECATRLADSAPSTIATEKALFWAMLPSPVITASQGGVTRETSAEAPATYVPMEEVGHAHVKASALAAPAPASPAGGESYTGEMIEDMRVQGASRPLELFGLSVGLQLGRRATPADLAKGQYGSTPTTAEGCRLAVKGREKLLSDLIETALKTGDTSLVDRHVNRTIERWMKDSTDALHMLASTRLGNFWSKAKQISEEPLVGVWFVQQYLDEYVGRGLPKLTDHELVRQAEKRAPVLLAIAGRPSVSPPTKSALSDMGAPPHAATASVSSMSSGMDSSAREDKLLSLITERFDALQQGHRDLVGEVRRVESKTATLADKVAKMGSPSARKDKCFKCGEEGHTARDCPNSKKGKKEDDS